MPVSAFHQGRTASLRAFALWLAFEMTVDFYIADLKGVGDWRDFLGLARSSSKGPPTTTSRRPPTWSSGASPRYRPLSPCSKSPAPPTASPARWPAQTPASGPVVLIVDEAQVAYGCGAKSEDGRPYGGSKATSRYFQAVKKIHDQGRAVNVTIWEGTQDPTDGNLPKRSREGNHIRGSLVLGTESQAKMALGEAPVDAGAAPHNIRRGKDRGTLVVAGEGIPLEAGESSVTVRTHFISGEDALVLTERAKARRETVATVHQLKVARPVDRTAASSWSMRPLRELRPAAFVVGSCCDRQGSPGWTVGLRGCGVCGCEPFRWRRAAAGPDRGKGGSTDWFRPVRPRVR
ncbi:MULTISPECIES: hypothetical protein [Streptomyces]|uniref:hypothetical protein n=1 Tax=Streptomyces TaxID=1883 RepID=UPI0004CCD8F8